MGNSIAFSLLILVALSSGRLAAAQSTQVSLHGTINVILAHKDNLVLLTDSRLSNTSGRVGYGQKLFQIDNHTICAIAGFYYNSGPAFPEVGNGLATDIPHIMRIYAGNRPRHPNATVETIARELAGMLLFSLELVADANRMAGSISADPLRVTVAGFENGKLKIARFNLIPDLTGGVGKRIYSFENLDTPLLSDAL